MSIHKKSYVGPEAGDENLEEADEIEWQEEDDLYGDDAYWSDLNDTSQTDGGPKIDDDTER